MGLREWLQGVAKQFLSPVESKGGAVDDRALAPRVPPPTLEVFGQAGHGRTSYLWALLFMLRKLSAVWPDYLCWSQDEPTTQALRSIHEALTAGGLPAPAADGEAARYSVVLQRLERWGRRPLVVWDRRDPVFSPAGAADAALAPVASLATPSWGVPALWLVSLPDLHGPEEQLIDLRLEQLMRARMAAEPWPGREPMKLIVVLTKADAIADLPPALRSYLKEDRLWEEESPAPAASAAIPTEVSAQHYLAALWRVDAEIRSWLQQRAAGRMLLRRAVEYHADLRFALVSATGSGLAGGRSGIVPWSPRRVLDPLFWALELDPPRAG